MARAPAPYYSSYGHVEKLAHENAGALEAWASADAKRVPALLSPEAARAANDQTTPDARIDDCDEYDAIVAGTGTRFGRASSQMTGFLDQAGGLWAKGALQGKVGGALASLATQPGGQETTLFTSTTIAGLDAQWQPSENELAGARYQARTIAATAAKLHG